MWGESSKNCEMNCQCSGLITESFKINSGNSATKRKQEEALANNYRVKVNPHALDFNRKQSPLSSPIATPSKRRVLGEIQNSPLFRPKDSPTIERLKKTPVNKSPLIERSLSPLSTRADRFKRSKISRIFEDRSKFKMSSKENSPLMSETFIKLDVEEETRDCSFGGFPSCSATKMANWSMAKLDFTDSLPTKSFQLEQTETKNIDMYVPEKETDVAPDFETLHDLEEEFDSHNFDECSKYEIISTDSPNIISSGRSSSRKISSRSFEFGAPLLESEQSTSFNKPNANATRMLNFEDEAFEFTSPAVKRSHSVSVKKSLKFTETPTKTLLRHERSDSSIGSMSSPASSKLRIFPSESTTSMESGFISELEEPFLDIEDVSNSPKMANFNELLSGQIKDCFAGNDFNLHRPLQRSISHNPKASKARVSLFSISESPTRKNNKRNDRSELENVSSKRRRSNCQSPEEEKPVRPVLQRAFSENHASIMSALTRFESEPSLIGDFTLPFALPLTCGNHTDLKSISCDTLAGLLRGEYENSITEFQVIDCRYPYEYEGGHIAGAVNLYTPDQVLSLVNEPLKPREPEEKRSILVFHCEFSLERGPKLSRFLRSKDRAKNKENYPSLHYPEVYLLHEGYRSFYQRYPNLCSPAGYTAMLDPSHRHLLKRHRSFSQPSSSKEKPVSNHRRNRLLL